MGWTDFNCGDCETTCMIPFIQCPSFFMEGSPSKIHTIDTTTGVLTLLTTLPDEVNAAGFNPNDGFLYARATDPTAANGSTNLSIYQIDSNGNYIEYYPIQGMPDPQAGNVGDIDGNGYLHITGAGTNAQSISVAVVDVNYGSPTYMTVVNTYTRNAVELGTDMSYNPSDGLFYSIRRNTGEILTLEPNTGVVTVIGTSTITGNYGATYLTSPTTIVGIDNTTGNLVKVDFSNVNNITTTTTGNVGISNIANSDGAGNYCCTPCGNNTVVCYDLFGDKYICINGTCNNSVGTQISESNLINAGGVSVDCYAQSTTNAGANTHYGSQFNNNAIATSESANIVNGNGTVTSNTISWNVQGVGSIQGISNQYWRFIYNGSSNPSITSEVMDLSSSLPGNPFASFRGSEGLGAVADMYVTDDGGTTWTLVPELGVNGFNLTDVQLTTLAGMDLTNIQFKIEASTAPLNSYINIYFAHFGNYEGITGQVSGI